MKRCDVSQVKIGTVYSCHSYGKVTEIDDGVIKLKNEYGFELEVDPSVFEAEYSTADQSVVDESVTRTELLKILTRECRIAMTVHFRKKLKPNSVAEALVGGIGTESQQTWLKKVAKALEGEERTMLGYHFGNFDLHGRLQFYEDGKMKLIDPRTIEWVIVDRRKLIVR